MIEKPVIKDTLTQHFLSSDTAVLFLVKPLPTNIYISKLTIETLEKGVKYV